MLEYGGWRKSHGKKNAPAAVIGFVVPRPCCCYLTVCACSKLPSFYNPRLVLFIFAVFPVLPLFLSLSLSLFVGYRVPRSPPLCLWDVVYHVCPPSVCGHRARATTSAGVGGSPRGAARVSPRGAGGTTGREGGEAGSAARRPSCSRRRCSRLRCSHRRRSHRRRRSRSRRSRHGTQAPIVVVVVALFVVALVVVVTPSRAVLPGRRRRCLLRRRQRRHLCKFLSAILIPRHTVLLCMRSSRCFLRQTV